MQYERLTTLPTKIRRLADTMTDVLSAKLMRDMADDLENIAISVALQPTDDNVKTLNCAWARATRLLSMQPNGKDAA